MFSWLFGQKRIGYEEFADNMYLTLVLEPPSSDDPEALGPSSLYLDLNSLKQFSEKRVLLLESMFVSAAIEASEGNPTPASQALMSKISNEWKNRKLITSSEADLMDMCTSEIVRLLNEPEQWSMKWLSEFYGKDDLRRVTVLLWAEQCNKEYMTMVRTMSKWIDY